MKLQQGYVFLVGLAVAVRRMTLLNWPRHSPGHCKQKRGRHRDLACASRRVSRGLRALDELALSPRAFLVGRGLIAEAVDFLACHLGCFAPASFATPTRDNAASKTASLREAANGDRPRRMIALFAAPLIHALQE